MLKGAGCIPDKQTNVPDRRILFPDTCCYIPRQPIYIYSDIPSIFFFFSFLLPPLLLQGRFIFLTLPGMRARGRSRSRSRDRRRRSVHLTAICLGRNVGATHSNLLIKGRGVGPAGTHVLGNFSMF